MKENIVEISWGCAIAIILLFILMQYKGFRNKVFKHIGLIAFIIWLCGIVLYMVGFNHEGSKHNYLVLFLRASLSSLEMFASHSDLLEVMHHWHKEPDYMLMFSLVHFMAVVTTSLFIFKLFGIRIKNWWRKLLFNRNKNKRTYIFWGINNESLTLAKEIYKNYDIVFVVDKETNNHNSEAGHHFSFSKLLGLSSIYDIEFEEIIETYNGTVYWHNNSFMLDSKLTKSRDTHILFLSDDEDENIANCIKIQNTNKFKDNNIQFYCHAHRSLENRRLAEIQNIKLIDSAFLSILELKQNGNAHPVNYVDLEKSNCQNTGIVTSCFNAMIIGFGDTGQEALSFLYEFSAFVGKDGNRSPYNITIIDKNANALKGNYIANRPALKNNSNIKFNQSEIGSPEYWNNIDSLIKEGLNYVIIALGNDHLNLSTAIRLKEYHMRFAAATVKNGSNNFCIYIKQEQKINDKIKELYNNSICPFGDRKTIFSSNFILNKSYEKSAEEYMKKYNAIKSQYIENYNIKETENTESQIIQIEELRKKYRVKTQNLSNAYHRHTIIKLLGKERIQELSEYNRIPKDVNVYTGKYSYIHKDDTQNVNEDITYLMTNLAKCEHLRWNAAIEMLGYTQNNDDRSSCNMISMQHNCLTSWEDLINIWKELKGKTPYCEYQQYDFNVVETSIHLEKTR